MRCNLARQEAGVRALSCEEAGEGVAGDMSDDRGAGRDAWVTAAPLAR
jgi:hypothetical protein